MKKKSRVAVLLGLALAIGIVLSLKQREPQRVVPDITRQAKSENVVPLPRLVDLGANRCVPCKAMAPILEELKETYSGQFEVEFIDVWENKGAAKQYQVKMIPTQIFYAADGKELYRHEGFFSREDILGQWAKSGVPLAEPGSQ